MKTLAFPHSREAFLASTLLRMLFSYQQEPPLSVLPEGYSYPSRSNWKNDFPKEDFSNHNPQLHCHPVYIFSFTLNSNGSVVKNHLPAMQETWARFLGQEDPLEEGMATHSSILARKMLWTEERGGLQSMGLQRVRHDWSDWPRTYQAYLTLGLIVVNHAPVNILEKVQGTSTWGKLF